ncbi:hypothetical protein NWP09_05870, partial [Agrococcus sp. HG114]|nr:hypothetical protein [Agrococcus sp. HG114]
MTGRARPASIDLAWFVALAGIVAGPTVLGGAPSAAERALLDGPPVALAALVAGVGAAHRARCRLAVGNRVGAVKAMLYRGLWLAIIASMLLLLDVLLQQAAGFWSLLRAGLGGVGAAVGELWVPAVEDPLLVPLGAAILLAAPLVAAPRWAIGVAAALLAAVAWWAPTADGIVAALPLEWDPGLAHALLGAGPRAAVALAVQVLLGLLVGRWLIAARGHGRE